MSAQTNSNNLKDFKTFIDNKESDLLNYANAIQYKYKLDINIYNNNTKNGSYVKSSPNQIMTNLGMDQMEEMHNIMGGGMFGSYEIWEEMLDNDLLLKSQYDLLAGKWPRKFNEVVLIVDKDNRISDYTLYSLGLLDPEDLTEKYKKLMKKEAVEDIKKQTYTYEELLKLRFRVVLNTDYYIKDRKYLERYVREWRIHEKGLK